MLQSLKLHPASRCTAVEAIAVDVARPDPRRLQLRYVVGGDLDRILLPPAAAPERADGLWRHTCFEAFVRAPFQEGYVELNLAPSRQWAAYRFERYRHGMAQADLPAPPHIQARREGGDLVLEALVDLGSAAGLDGRRLLLGLSAVIEELDGVVSYWALAHAPGRADFHHPDCFALELPAPEHP